MGARDHHWNHNERNRVIQYVSTNGDGTGTIDMNLQNVTPTHYFVEPADNEIYVLERMLVVIIDSAFTNANTYGAVTLATGISITLENGDGETLVDFTPVNLTKTVHWTHLAGVDVDVSDSGGDDGLSIRWTFTKGGEPLIIDGSQDEFLRVTCNDDMRGLVEHRMTVQGFKKTLD